MDCKDIKTLIIGGTVTQPKEFPHMVIILNYNNNNNNSVIRVHSSVCIGGKLAGLVGLPRKNRKERVGLWRIVGQQQMDIDGSTL